MRLLACMLLVILLLGCGQTKTGTSNEIQESDNSNSPEVESDNSLYTIFNVGTLDDFTANFNDRFEELYKSQNKGDIPQTIIDDYEDLGGTFEFRFSPFLGINCVINEDGTMGMVVLFKLKPVEGSPNEEFYDEEMIDEYHAIVQQALIAATAPGATTKELKEINSRWEEEFKQGKEQTEIIFNDIAYMASTDTTDPTLTRDFFYITYK